MQMNVKKKEGIGESREHVREVAGVGKCTREDKRYKEKEKYKCMFIIVY